MKLNRNLELYAQLIKRVELIRMSNNLSKSEFAALIEISKTGYSKFTKNNQSISIEQFLNICSKFNIDADSLLFGIEREELIYYNGKLTEDKTPTKPSKKKADRLEGKTIEEWQNLSRFYESERNQLLKIILNK